jgi:hypothetical protein
MTAKPQPDGRDHDAHCSPISTHWGDNEAGVVDRQTRRPVPLPDALLASLAPLRRAAPG